MSKLFPGQASSSPGRIESFDRELGYHVKYDDGDEEDLGILAVREILLEN